MTSITRIVRPECFEPRAFAQFLYEAAPDRDAVGRPISWAEQGPEGEEENVQYGSAILNVLRASGVIAIPVAATVDALRFTPDGLGFAAFQATHGYLSADDAQVAWDRDTAEHQADVWLMELVFNRMLQEGIVG